MYLLFHVKIIDIDIYIIFLNKNYIYIVLNIIAMSLKLYLFIKRKSILDFSLEFYFQKMYLLLSIHCVQFFFTLFLYCATKRCSLNCSCNYKSQWYLSKNCFSKKRKTSAAYVENVTWYLLLLFIFYLYKSKHEFIKKKKKIALHTIIYIYDIYRMIMYNRIYRNLNTFTICGYKNAVCLPERYFSLQ